MELKNLKLSLSQKGGLHGRSCRPPNNPGRQCSWVELICTRLAEFLPATLAVNHRLRRCRATRPWYVSSELTTTANLKLQAGQHHIVDDNEPLRGRLQGVFYGPFLLFLDTSRWNW